jgi:hypothetical protein
MSSRTNGMPLRARLRQIDEALGEMPGNRRAQIQTGPGRRPSGGISLKNLVIEVLSSGPKTKEEVLEQVQRRGYKFFTTNPLNSLGVILYGKNPKFNRVEGRFSVGPGVSSPQRSGTGRRQMSAAARARISAAQRKRWAASRKEQTKETSSNGAAKPAKWKLTPAARKKIAEAARKRWAAAKAAGKTSL